MAGGGARPLQAVRAAAVRTAGAGPLPSVSRGTVRNRGQMPETTPLHRPLVSAAIALGVGSGAAAIAAFLGASASARRVGHASGWTP